MSNFMDVYIDFAITGNVKWTSIDDIYHKNENKTYTVSADKII